jgi:arginyl-tRNA synthetase
MNYLGDWGKHIGLLASGWARFGSDEEFAKDPMRHMTDVFHKIQELFKPEEEASKAAKAENKDTAEIESQGIYAERNSFFKRMEDRDQEAIDLWQRFRDASIEYYKGSYAKLGIQFDEYSGESTYSAESVAEIESKLKDNGVYEESDGSWIIDFAKHGSRGLGVAVVRYRNGTTSYLLRDIAAVLDRHKAHGFDKMIYVAAMELDNYFQRVIRTLQLIDKADIAAKLQHVNFAKMTGIPEQLASARLLDDYIVGCAEMMREHMPSEGAEDVYVTPSDDVVTNLGLSALVAQDFCRKKSGAVPFDVARMTAFDGETGPAFQNCYARLLKLLGQQPPVTDYATLDYSQLEGADHSELLRTISQYPDAVSAMYRNMEPTGIMMYAFRLVDQLMYTIDDETCDWASEDDGTRARLALYETARIVLESALTLLGITPLSQ